MNKKNINKKFIRKKYRQATVIIWHDGHIQFDGDMEIINKIIKVWAAKGYPLDIIGCQCG